ncbi:MAG: hypothetical protein ACFNLE_05500, partial [Rothia aeria]
MSSQEQNTSAGASLEPETSQDPGKKQVPPEFFRQPYSFVRRGDRLTLGGRFQAVEYTDKKSKASGDAKRFSP